MRPADLQELFQNTRADRPSWGAGPGGDVYERVVRRGRRLRRRRRGGVAFGSLALCAGVGLGVSFASLPAHGPRPVVITQEPARSISGAVTNTAPTTVTPAPSQPSGSAAGSTPPTTVTPAPSQDSDCGSTSSIVPPGPSTPPAGQLSPPVTTKAPPDLHTVYNPPVGSCGP